MNIYLLIANALTLVAFIVHTWEGDKDLGTIKPMKNELVKQEKWTQARAGWHWVSIDLLLVTVALAFLNFTKILEPHDQFLIQLLAICFFVYAASWILVIFVSDSFKNNYLKLGQWLLLLLIGGLLQLSVV